MCDAAATTVYTPGSEHTCATLRSNGLSWGEMSSELPETINGGVWLWDVGLCALYVLPLSLIAK